MARITISDLPVLEDLSAREIKGIFGGTLRTAPGQASLTPVGGLGGDISGSPIGAAFAEFDADVSFASIGQIEPEFSDGFESGDVYQWSRMDE